MKKIIGLVLAVVICLSSVKAFADLASANALYLEGKLPEARAEYVAIEVGGGTLKAEARYRLAFCYQWEQNYPTARAEYAKVAQVIDTGFISLSKYHIAECFEAEGNSVAAQEAYKETMLIKNCPPFALLKAFTKIDFGSMTKADRDTFLTAAYYTCDGTLQDKDGNYIHTEYLGKLMFKMSATAQASIKEVK